MRQRATETTSASDSTPPLTNQGSISLKGIEERRSLLVEKIKTTQEVCYPSSQQGYSKLNTCQESYVKNLQSILTAIDNDPTISGQEEGVIAKIEFAVDEMMKLAGDLKKYIEGVITDEVEGIKRPYTGAVGEGAESLLHYLDYVKDLKTGNSKRALIDFCLAKKCLAKFNALESARQGRQKEEKLFAKAFSSYSEAIESNSFGEETFEGAGDNFFSAATMYHKNEQEFSEFYEQAAICFEKANQSCLSRVPAEKARHDQAAGYWSLSGNNTLNTIHALQLKRTNEFEMYNMARECFQRVAEKLPLLDSNPEVFNEIKTLDEAGNYFVSAAEAMKTNESTLASIHKSLGLCHYDSAEALSKNNTQAQNYFEKAKHRLNTALFSLSEKVTSSEERYQSQCRSAGKSYYMMGKALLNGNEKLVKLHEKIAECYEELLNNSREEGSLKALEVAIKYYTNAVVLIQTEKKEIAKLYEQVGECSRHVATSSHPEAIREWEQARECYLNIVHQEKKDFEEQNNILQLFKSAAKYSEIAAQELEKGPSRDDRVATSLVGSALNLKLAAEALQEGDQELAAAYEACATSHYYFAVANKPALVEHLALSLHLGFKKDVPVSDSVKAYWEKVTIENHHKINKLLEVRASASSGGVGR